jgi:molybdenum cofactor cytidylyltransferase
MIFGETPVETAEGAILAHSVKHRSGLFKKGRVLSAEDITLLRESGVATIFAARLAQNDIAEDEAAAAVAKAIAGNGATVQAPFTGRANLHAAHRGLAVVDADRVKAFNRIHESLTLATVTSHDIVEERQLVATVKVIPFAVANDVLIQALDVIGSDPLIRVEAFKHRRVGLVITRLPQTKATIIAKSEESIRERIAALEGDVGEVIVVDHSVEAVKVATARLHAGGFNPILIFGASAIVDRGDIIPAGLVAAGGEVVHLGMPVDPGNLMMFGRLDGAPVIGVPSCARSPKVNGFDWVLARVMAGLHVSAQDIMDMGAGGLLKEIPSRPEPREGGKPKSQMAPKIAAIVLAAGQSTRMGSNKLLANFGGQPMVRRTVESTLASGARPVIVVTGHQAEEIRAALSGLDVTFVHNPDYAKGLSTSLNTGLAALPADVGGAVICLADMPLVGPTTIDRLIAAYNPVENRTIVVPMRQGERGNPVLWGSKHFAEIMKLSGDRGARALMERFAEEVVEIGERSDAVLVDVDTPEALERVKSASVP